MAGGVRLVGISLPILTFYKFKCSCPIAVSSKEFVLLILKNSCNLWNSTLFVIED